MKRKHKITSWISIPLLAVLLPVTFLSCSEDIYNDSEFVAGDLFTNSNIRVIHIDTCTIATSTMKFDSIVTSLSSRILVGKYIDPVFGVVKSSSYMELLPNSYTIDSEAEFDSIVFYLGMDGYYYNDTLQTNTIHIKQVLENLKPKNGDNFYNTSNVAYADTVIGSQSYKPRPLRADSLEIKLSDDLGFQFFEKFQKKEITNSAEFQEYFKGVTLQPGEEDNGAIIGLSKSSDKSYVRLYFSTAETDGRLQSYINFTINITSTPTPFFNSITAEEPNDYLKSLTNKEMNLNSSYSENLSFIQSGIGIATRVQFPYIKNIYDIEGQGTLLNAVLKIKPAKQSYNNNLILRDSLSVYQVDVNNDLVEQLGETAILNTENQEFNDIYYELPLTSYIEKLLTAERDTGEALILLPSNYNSTVDRFVLTGSNNAEYTTSLELTYTIYSEDE